MRLLRVEYGTGAIDGILRGWQADGVRTLGDVEARREARRKPEPSQEKKMEVLT